MHNQNITLNKEDKLLVGLSWENFSQGEEMDIDLLAIMLDKNKKFVNKFDLIFYNNLFSRTGALFHTGDNKTGNSSSDDEVILVNLSQIPNSIKYIKFAILNHSKTKDASNISFRIAKIYDIFETKGNNIYTHKFENNDFYLMYVFEIEITENFEYKINIKLREITQDLEDIFKMYNIKPEELKPAL